MGQLERFGKGMRLRKLMNKFLRIAQYKRRSPGEPHGFHRRFLTVNRTVFLTGSWFRMVPDLIIRAEYGTTGRRPLISFKIQSNFLAGPKTIHPYIPPVVPTRPGRRNYLDVLCF